MNKIKTALAYRDATGKITPFGRAVRTFLQAGLPAFVVLAGFDTIAQTGTVHVGLLGRAAVAGVGAGLAAVIAFVQNSLEQ